MLVLLPPSETKRVGGVERLEWDALHGHAELGAVRREVSVALEKLSAGDQEVAAKALKLGVKNRGELDYNLELASSGVMPAIERYTGVVYDALDVMTLDASARAWVDDHVYVQSALFGLLAAGDEIPAYRLSAGSRLPALDAPLKRLWGEAHAVLPWPGNGFVLDLRSKDYAALAPVPVDMGWSLHVVQRGSDGVVRALNHFNKAAKGDLVRRLATSGTNVSDAEAFVTWGEGVGLELSVQARERTITLVTELGAPTRS